MYSCSLYIFRRDLRLTDNTGLIAALKSSGYVVPCFIFDPRQVDRDKNVYRSDAALQFMLESLYDLGEQLKHAGGRLYLFKGIAEDVVKELVKDLKPDALYINRDYTPYSIMRDKAIKEVCEEEKVSFNSFGDYLINEPEDVLKSDGRPYTVFTAFYRRCIKEKIRPIQVNKYQNYFTEEIRLDVGDTVFDEILPQTQRKTTEIRGGRKEALKILEDIHRYRNYGRERDFPALNATTHLSPHLKYGTISVREVYNKIAEELGIDHPLIRQLYWRDFYTHIGYHFPHVFGKSFHEKFDKIRWSNDAEKYVRWCEGRTGFPIVDAGMHELNQTGYMHNRVRMITASFLVKDLNIDWRWGEKYFAQKLIDYDPCVNNGNWQWSASTGCDPQPYFRIFNPWLQQKKYDPKCIYIKKWVPELAEIPSHIIHNLYKKKTKIKNYPKPIIDHRKESTKTKKRFRELRNS